MKECRKHKIGWFVWSWGLIGNADCAEMDMTVDGKKGKFEGLANRGVEVAVTDPFNIRNTS